MKDGNQNKENLQSPEAELLYLLQETLNPDVAFANVFIAKRLNVIYQNDLSTFSAIQRAQLKEMTFYHLPQTADVIPYKPHLDKKAALAQNLVEAGDKISPKLLEYAKNTLTILSDYAPRVEQYQKPLSGKARKDAVKAGKKRAKKEASEVAQKLSMLIDHPNDLDVEEVAKTIFKATINRSFMNWRQRRSVRALIKDVMPKRLSSARLNTVSRCKQMSAICSQVTATSQVPYKLFDHARKSQRIIQRTLDKGLAVPDTK